MYCPKALLQLILRKTGQQEAGRCEKAGVTRNNAIRVVLHFHVGVPIPRRDFVVEKEVHELIERGASEVVLRVPFHGT